MLTLPNGCSCSNPTVHPKNWKTPNASVKIDWYVHYRFHDSTGRCRQVFVKGMNKYKVHHQRRDATQALLDNELHILMHEGFNPITGRCIPAPAAEDRSLYPIDEYTPFIEALKEADKRLEVSKSTHDNVRSILRYVEKAAKQNEIARKPISSIRRRDIRFLLDKCGALKKKWTANTFNHYRAHLMMLFKKIVEYEAIDTNPVTNIEKKKVVRKIRPVLSEDNRKKVNEHLKQRCYTFWRFMHIFFHSGARETELLRLKGKDVDLNAQSFTTVIMKRKTPTQIQRTIKDIAIPLWTELLSNCDPEDFIFSRHLKPGKTSIRPDQIAKRWYKYVKEPLGIKEDFYSLKHLNTSETVDILDDQDAAAMNAHTSTAMVVNIYDVKRKSRQHERLKKVSNYFSRD